MNFIKDIFNFNRKDSTEKVFDSLYNIIIKTELSIDYDVNWDMRNVNSIHPFSLASLAIYRQMAKKKIECVNIAPKMKEYFNMAHFNKPLAVEYAMEELEHTTTCHICRYVSLIYTRTILTIYNVFFNSLYCSRAKQRRNLKRHCHIF